MRCASLALAAFTAMILGSGCRLFSGESKSLADPGSPLTGDRFAKVKAALPKVAYRQLQNILESAETVWYDHDSMNPSYQAAIRESPPYGANTNDKWFDLIADSVQPVARQFYDSTRRHWRFPFATTAGADESSNLQVANFLWLPTKNGQRLPLAAGAKPQSIAASGFTMYSWGWVYPVGSIVGEIIFITDAAGELLPSEIRVRQRYASGWAINVFRPFISAAALASAIKQRRPQWNEFPGIRQLVTHLENPATLKAHRLAAPQLPGVFDQNGALDELPDFGDQSLAKELLIQTTFVSAYGESWKAGSGLTAYAPTSSAGTSIVPNNYKAGVIAVNEASCMRCHKETGRHLTDFSPEFSSIVLYGEMWGRDGIFSFHPFDESKYDVFWLSGTTDNRALNPRLKAAGIITAFDSAVHRPPEYPSEEIGFLGGESLPGSNSGTGGNAGSSNIVEFHIPAGTGSGEWNLRSSPAQARPGQIIRIINDDSTAHVLHTNGEPCPHGDTARPLTQGEHYDCAIPADTPSGTEYRLWDHFLGDPSSGRFWIKVE